MERTKVQIIWYRKKTQNGWRDETEPLELRLPKTINTDISFQLQFGPHESPTQWRNKVLDHQKKSGSTTKTINEYNLPIKWI